jgi:mono/diheme cytochrome c family protein
MRVFEEFVRRAKRGLMVASALAFGVAACNRAPSDLREWRASDHDQADNPAQEGQVDGSNSLASLGIDEVTLAAWRENCVKCHGPMGRGDGPQGAMTRARDLSDAAFQAATPDEAIANTIRQGRGMMPAFNLPANTVSALVRLVRLFDARRRNAEPAQQ